ncbi:hypothetical protein N7463_008255 [Penicillium fimorum]|uniref:Uncharacterized protein n=1 Tax=Penicillium fimorum TaxID=1882269 RepID=A0A9X0C324_9EURO|nr:hypothetical protein N7463_008255 [Penicillium fimorum]
MLALLWRLLVKTPKDELDMQVHHGLFVHAQIAIEKPEKIRTENYSRLELRIGHVVIYRERRQ